MNVDALAGTGHVLGNAEDASDDDVDALIVILVMFLC